MNKNQYDVGGPYFDDLTVGQVFDTAPSVTLTEGMSATHQSIVGDRVRMALDATLSQAVTGSVRPLANPALVCDLAIGQSTLATHHVKANLFYRGLRFHRHPYVGDTLHTRTEVVGLRANSTKPGRRPTGLAALRMTSTNQNGEVVLDFYRCAMLPLSDGADPHRHRHADDLSAVGIGPQPPFAVPAGWDLAEFGDRVPGGRFDPRSIGSTFQSSGDVVSSAPELARLTLNVAATHHDERVGSAGRLVYGGHTIGIALGQATRALPHIVTVLGWTSCDHTGPVHEGDTVHSELRLDSAAELDGGWVLHLRSTVRSYDSAGEDRPVLDWRFSVLMA